MKTFASSGATTATAAAADNGVCAIWNPSTTKRIWLAQLHLAKTAAGGADRPKLRRISARGTASATATPGAANDYTGGQVAPESGWLLDLAYSVQPTFKSGDLDQYVLPAAVGGGVMWVFTDDPIEIPPGEGIVVATGSALAMPVLVATAKVRE